MAPLFAPVPAIPPKGPGISLLDMAIMPDLAAQDSLDSTQTLEGARPVISLSPIAGEGSPSRWTGGFEYAPENQWAGTAADPCDTADELDVSNSNQAIVQYLPFLVVTTDQCTALQWEKRDFEGRATRRLINALPGAIEHELWTGTYAIDKGYDFDGSAPNTSLHVNNFLADDADPNFTDLTPIGGPPSVARGIQILEDALTQTGYGGQGMIHTQPQTAPNLLGARRVNKQFLTLLDNLVIPGVGYDGSAPVSNPHPVDGTAWIYATDLISVRIDPFVAFLPESMAEALDRSGQIENESNLIRFYAQCFAAATWDGFRHFAIQVLLAD